MKKPISIDLRERIVGAYDAKEGTREEVAKRFKVSLGMVKKLLAQRERTGDLRARYRYCGRKAKLMPERGRELKELVAKEPDLTLEEIKQRLGLECTVAAIHWVLARMGLTYKKRRSMRPSRTVPMWRKPDVVGGGARAGSIRRGWSSSTSRRPKPT
jgi:Transposase and inactivated derivatives